MASYGKDPSKLQRAVESLQQHSVTDWRLFLIHNPSEGDEATWKAACDIEESSGGRILSDWMPKNVGYAGAVCELMRRSETEYTAWLDNDTDILTHGWDEILCGYLDRFHEIGMIFPGSGAYPIDRGNYSECMWAPGFCWVLSRMCMTDTGAFDTTLGHQEEADYSLRVRIAGYKCAGAREVHVHHDATATNNPAAIERISRGVVNWVNKWAAYFGGKNLNYHSPNVLRWEDWSPNALYLEEYMKLKLPGLNDAPEVVSIDGREYDLIKVPRFKDFYRGRII